jgi:aquaporin Z
MSARRGAAAALREHWPEYLIEAWALGTFMVSAAVWSVLLGHAGSPLHEAIPQPGLRRALGGLAMGLTAIALIYSPWGQRSGAHMNPAVTLTYWRLRKVAGWDALFYVLAQFTGGTLGVLLMAQVLGAAFTAPPVQYAATLPGSGGVLAAFAAEIFISALLMSMVLRVSNAPRLARFTGVFAGCLVACFITLEAPLSGMSMNPARSFASAFPAGLWAHFWIYAAAPLLGMQLAALVYRLELAGRVGGCAKLVHSTQQRCIHCGYEPRQESPCPSRTM